MQVLVTSELIGQENVRRLSRLAEVVESWKLDEEGIRDALPGIDAAIVLFWPRFFTSENLATMRRLKFIQTILVGVNHVKFDELPRGVVVCSNAGAYSTEVGEHAWGLLLAAAKRIVAHHSAIREGGKTLASFAGEEKRMKVLHGKTLGIIGFGGIGRTVARYGPAFGMKVMAFNRSRKRAAGVRLYYGRRGFEKVLRTSDAVILSAPLTRTTDHFIGERELALMKKDAVLVNVARGDLVDQNAVFAHLSANPSFTYATDAWWSKEGRETLETDGPMAALPNFIGTPHLSGPTALVGGGPQREAVENTILFLRGRKPKNVVYWSDYLVR